jgi:Ca2+-binding RTX toxin-like protein
VNRVLLEQADPAFDIVHANSEFAGQVSDHDPAVARLDFRAFGELLRLGSGADDADGLGGADTVAGGAGRDTLGGGAGDDRLLGQANPDLLESGAGRDTLAGGGGRDTLDGGADADTLTGGDGADLLVLRAADGPGRDVIVDFDAAGGDAILLDGFVVDSGEEALAASRQAGAGVRVDLGEVQLYLRDTLLEELSASDFLFA